MPRTWFHPPVAIEGERVGLTLQVNSAERATEALLSWKDRGPAWLRAAEMCLAAQEGRAPQLAAREAFRAAAEEADKLLFGKQLKS